MYNIEIRKDCDAFEVKQNVNDYGDCQTDGHYLCKGCKHIASFDCMEYHDNKITYYYLTIENYVITEFLKWLLTIKNR